MDVSKLSSNQKLALTGAIAVFLAGLICNWGGTLWLSILAAMGVAVILFLPQLSPDTTLPGSRGSLLAVLGFVALGGALFELLRYLNYTFNTLDKFSTWMFLVALVASGVLAWAGWQELQGEGGTWVLGGSSTSGAAAEPTAVQPAIDPEVPAPSDARSDYGDRPGA